MSENSDKTLAGLSVVRREEENAAKESRMEAMDISANAELPGNNDAVDAAEEHKQNADNLADVGANHGYTE